jgi:hypothetical protein
MTTARETDWAAVEHRARRADLLTLTVLGAWFASVTALTGRFVVAGAGRWWVVGGVLVLMSVLLVLQRQVPRLRRSAELGHRVQFALRHHVDPGNGAREKADTGARRLARLRWVVWLSPVVALAVLAGGRWDQPAVAVPAALVFLAVVTAGVVHVHRQVREARRWVADPPGPAREVAPPSRLESWTTGRRAWIVVGVYLLLAVLAGLVAGILS